VCWGIFGWIVVEVSVLISLPVAFAFSIPVGPGDDGRGLCVELVLPIPSAVGSTPPSSDSATNRSARQVL
jgi:hypothetical protein